jgi:vancomycin permeability regulator SanA
MKKAHSARCPGGVYYIDSAGFETLDSIPRANSVSGVDNMIIITEKFYTPSLFKIVL